jgi:menaquinone-dependent protoporphyrinogen oxidase
MGGEHLKALVAFGTRYGSTVAVAEAVGEELRRRGYDVEVRDLRSGAGGVDGSDLVVIGSSVFVGKWTKEAERFLEHNTDAMAKKRYALFVSCSDVLFPERVEAGRKMYLQDVATSLPGDGPVAMGMFGGVIDFGHYSALTKALLAGVGTKKQLKERGIDPSLPYDFRDWEEIRTWARAL